MLFNSFSFIIFFIITTFIYYMSSYKFKWIVILFSSFVFYFFSNPIFILLVLFSTFINWYFAIKIFQNTKKNIRKLYLLICLIVTLSILFLFKYLNFVNQTISYFLKFININYEYQFFNIMLPLGISFYTFQLVSYIVDIYKNKYIPEKNFFKLLLFIMFFPPLIAGPIERANYLLPQFFKKNKFSFENISLGTKYIILGFFKKIVIADRISKTVNIVYNNPNNFNSLSLIMATILFSIQIYCDFSGYTDISIGCSKVLGINLTENFKKPYLSKTIKEFWSRWHISLSTWFRDYLYIPLGGNRCSFLKMYFNIFITFIVSGIWHGANLTFIVWGALHGAYQILENMLSICLESKCLKKFNFKNILIIKIIRTIFIFLLISFTWIFFKSKNIHDALYISSHLFNDIKLNKQYVYNTFLELNINFFEYKIIIISIIILYILDIYSKNYDIHKILLKKQFIIRFLIYYIILFLVITLGVYDNAGEFIYFKF